jgi:hypothetical protein
MSKRYNAVILIQELQSLLFCKFNFWHSILYFFVSAEGSALFLRDIKLVLLLRQLAMDNNADVSTPTLLSISGDFFVDLLFGDDIEFTIYNI